MSVSTFFIPSVNMLGVGALSAATGMMVEYGFRRSLIVTDTGLTKS
ncbi:TPA: L-threonine dehydrogenase, partial [Escherichia coli]